MAIIQKGGRFYPQHDADKPVSPKELNNHIRFMMDTVYDVQTAIQHMMGGPIILTTLTAGAVTKLQIAFPAYGFPDGTYPIVFSGGGGSGAKGTAKASGGKIVSTTLTAGGAYAAPPSATVALP